MLNTIDYCFQVVRGEPTEPAVTIMQHYEEIGFTSKFEKLFF